jgi:hypothetical protein
MHPSLSITPLGKQYAKLLLDPCAANLVHSPGLGSAESGYLIRLYRRYVLHSVAATNNGMFVWFPGYHNGNTTTTGFNMFSFEDASTFTNLVNTGAIPLGGGGVGAGSAQNDPGHTWVNGSNVAEARTIAACMKAYYTGALTSTSGTLAVVPNITPHNLLQGGSSGGLPSIADIISMSPRIARTPLDPVEVRWAPARNDLVYKSSNRPADLLYQNTAGNPTTLGSAAAGAEGIAFAWNGLPNTTTGDLVIECYKVLEWRPDTVGITGVTHVEKPLDSFESIMSYIDHYFPDWKIQAVNTAASMVASTALGGTGLDIVNKAMSFMRV